ncbi:MAG: head maturation protease, ClpP-related [Pseudomonadota bacterium]
MLQFRIVAKADPKAAAEIYIYGDIGEAWWEETTSAIQFVKDLNALKNEEITIRINSVGGSVPDGLAIHNAIQRHPSAINIVIDGMAMSIASLIAMAAPCSMAENAVLMVHAPMRRAVGNARDLRIAADQLDTWAQAMAVSYAAKCGKSTDEVVAELLDGEDHYYTAAEAQAEGFVDEVTEAVAIAATYRVPDAAVSRFSIPDAALAAPFTIKPARAAQSGGSVMDRIEQIRALFAQHMGNAQLKALFDQLIADEAITVEAAKAKLDAALAAANPPPSATGGTAPAASAPAGAAPSAPSAEHAPEAVAEGVRLEAERRQGIEAAFQPFARDESVTQLRAQCLNDTAVTVAVANQRLLAALGQSAEPAAGHVRVRENPEREKFQEGVVAAVLARAGKADDKTRKLAMASGFHNFTLMELAKASLVRANVDFSAMNPQQIARAALTQSTSDFSVLLENAMHKALLMAYQTAGDTWSMFCRTGSVSDFRAHGRYRTGSIGNYMTVTENGEYENVAIPDGEKGSITAADTGLIINLTYQMIVNDDIGAFLGLASDLGRAGRRTVEAAVYALLNENSGLGPDMGDGNPLFHSSRSNVGTGAALTMASIEADRVVMASQQDVGGNDFLDLRPSVWLGSLSQGGQARSINDSQYDPDTPNKLNKPNIVRGLFNEVVDTPRLSGTRYYLFTNPADAPVIEVAFLNGQSEPYIVMEEAFTSRGARYRATLDFGTAAIDYRGAVTNAGTA